MSKLQNVWVIAESESAVKELSAGAAQLGEKATLVSFGAPDSFTAVIPGIVAAVKEKAPNLVLVEASRNGRLAAAMIAAAVGTSALTDCTEIKVEGDAVVAKRMVYGGAAFKTEKATGIVVAIIGTGVFEAGTPASDKIEIAASAPAGIKFVEKKAKAGHTVNLGAAKRVVSVGRGLCAEANLAMVNDFAALIGAEVGCTRPVAEEQKWLPKESYIGVSGVMLKPDIYIGVGVSGQVQHMVGVNQAMTIVAINKDKNAPIFRQCDYGIVGDFSKIIPALVNKFKA